MHYGNSWKAPSGQSVQQTGNGLFWLITPSISQFQEPCYRTIWKSDSSSFVASLAKFGVNLLIQRPQALLAGLLHVKQRYTIWLHTHSACQDADSLMGQGGTHNMAKRIQTQITWFRVLYTMERPISETNSTNLKILCTCRYQNHPTNLTEGIPEEYFRSHAESYMYPA